MSLDFHFLTLFPEVIQGALSGSLMEKASKRGLVRFHYTQIRDFALDKHKTTDETPYGGGEGMILRADVLYDAWKSAIPEKTPDTLTILLSPQGRRFDQAMAHEFKNFRKVVLVCGHYEGVDERFIELCVDREVSIGDYVLTGGELPAAIIAETVTRLVPGVVGNEKSLTADSLEDDLLKYPQYTRPREFQGLEVPEILMSGNHGKIEAWRQQQREHRTQLRRPDLWERVQQRRRRNPVKPSR